MRPLKENEIRIMSQVNEQLWLKEVLDQLWDLLLASDTPFDKACKYSTFIHVHIAPLGTAPRRLTYLCKDGKTWTNRTHVPFGD